MFSMFSDMNDTMKMFDAFERQMQRAFSQKAVFPEIRDMSLRDRGEELVLTADMPGFTDKDIELTLEGDVLTFKAERAREIPKGHRLIRLERRDVKWHRQYELPCRVDANAVTASLENGVLTVHLPKAAESKPKKIQIGTPVTAELPKA